MPLPTIMEKRLRGLSLSTELHPRYCKQHAPHQHSHATMSIWQNYNMGKLGKDKMLHLNDHLAKL